MSKLRCLVCGSPMVSTAENGYTGCCSTCICYNLYHLYREIRDADSRSQNAIRMAGLKAVSGEIPDSILRGAELVYGKVADDGTEPSDIPGTTNSVLSGIRTETITVTSDQLKSGLMDILGGDSLSIRNITITANEPFESISICRGDGKTMSIDVEVERWETIVPETGGENETEDEG